MGFGKGPFGGGPGKGPVPTGGVVYRMRGFDQNVSVNRVVYWNSSEIDTDASEYTGSAGPVVDILVAGKSGEA